jgi:hypothetical protein
VLFLFYNSLPDGPDDFVDLFGLFCGFFKIIPGFSGAAAAPGPQKSRTLYYWCY